MRDAIQLMLEVKVWFNTEIRLTLRYACKISILDFI